MNEEIVLINPPSKRTSHTKYTVHHGIAPIGMAYIAGALKEAGFRSQIIDAVGEDLEYHELYHRERGIFLRGLPIREVVRRISKQAKYILISSMYLSDWVVVDDLISQIKKRFPNSTIILGGENPTTFWNKILEFNESVDFCVIGEGDEILPELLRTIQKDGEVKEVLGIAFRSQNGSPVMTQRPPRIKELSSFKPCWDGFPLENYFKQRTTSRAIGKRSMPLIASRGCVYRCTFCTSETKWGTTFVTREIQEVVDQFREYKEKYNVEHICVVDLAASIDRKWFMALVKALAEADIGISWELSSGTRSEFLTRENLELMIKSNFTYLTLAPDAGSEKTVMDIEKRINMGRLERALDDVIDLGMWVKTNFIVGMYGQSREEVINTYKMALKYAWKGVNDVVLYPYVPFPGSKMFDRMIVEGSVDLSRKDKFDEFILDVSTYSIVALNNPNIKYDHDLVKYHQFVMVICFFITMIRKPSRIYVFIKRMLTKKAVGVFEVALYQSVNWYVLMAKIKVRNLLGLEKYPKEETAPFHALEVSKGFSNE